MIWENSNGEMRLFQLCEWTTFEEMKFGCEE